MKLKTKLVLIFCLILALTIFLTDLLVYNLSAESMMEEARQAAFLESEAVFRGIKEFSDGFTGVFSKSLVKYYLSSSGDKFTVSVKDGEEYYNYTVLSISQFTEGGYTDYKGLKYKEATVNGNDILIFTSTEKGVNFFRIIDITHVYQRLNNLILFMTAVSFSLITLSALVIHFVVRKTLSPLSELSKAARRIAEGAYGERFDSRTKDEVGSLGDDFNNMAEAVEKHTKMLEEAEYKKTMFMADLTHELKTPITAISGYAQLLRNIEMSEDDKIDALTYIYEESVRLDRLSRKLMRILGLENETKIEFIEHNLNDIVSTALKSCRKAAESKNITFETDVPDIVLECDFDLMCDLFINLIDNSMKATGNKGVITISADNTFFKISDNGCGIPSQELERIVEPFYMVDKSRSRKNGGSGLGLALVNEIVKLHGMEMVIDSEVGKGTTVTVYF